MIVVDEELHRLGKLGKSSSRDDYNVLLGRGGIGIEKMIEVLDVLGFVGDCDGSALEDVLESTRSGEALDVPEELILAVLLRCEKVAVQMGPVELRHCACNWSARRREVKDAPQGYGVEMLINSSRSGIIGAPVQKSLWILFPHDRFESYACDLSRTSWNDPTADSGHE